jgi:anti-sigma regulatory factor (Ser/Thr protein kinase)/CheY-like chemotaxis protein
MKATRQVLLAGVVPEIADALEGLQCEVVIAESLESATAALRGSKFDLVLCDYSSLDPLGATDRSVPVIVLSGDIPNAFVTAGMERAFALVDLPFDRSHVRELVFEALNNPDQPDSIQIESRDPNFLILRLRSTIATADRLMRFAMRMKADLPPEERRQAAIAFREMLLNAIEHGGKLDPNQWVRVCRVRSKRSVIYYIQDPGEGFSRGDLKHAAISNPEDAPALHMSYRQDHGLRSGGFGILMAQNLVDEIIYNEQGNAVVLIKHLD